MSGTSSDIHSSADFAFLDSGTGGIPYMLSLKQKQKNARCVYLGDTANFPYGQKSVEQITECAARSVSLIIKKWNPKTLIIACNTISVTALDSLRKLFPELPIVGTVPAVKLAAKVSENKKIGFLATNASVNSPYSKKLIADFASDCQFFNRGDPELIDFVEKNFFTASRQEIEQAVKPAVDYFKSNGCDTIILGCTHFTHIADEIQKVAGENIKVIDSREGVSNQAIRVENSSSASVQNLYEQKNCISSFEDMAFYCTKAGIKEQNEYKELCRQVNIPWGGVIS